MQFGDRLKNLRTERGLTQKELGKQLNISDRVVGYYESNERFPRDPDTIKSIANFFEVTTDYLLGYSNIRNPYKDEELTVTDDDVIAAHGKTEKVELSEEDLQDIQDFLKQMRKDK